METLGAKEPRRLEVGNVGVIDDGADDGDDDEDGDEEDDDGGEEAEGGEATSSLL